MKYFQILSHKSSCSIEKLITFLKEIYAMEEKKFIFTDFQVTRLHILKDERQKIQFIIGTNMKPYPFEKMLGRYYGEDTLHEVEAPKFTQLGRTLKAKNKLFDLHTKDLLTHIIEYIPEGVVFTMDITKERGKTLAMLAGEETKLRESKSTSIYDDERKKSIKNRLEDAYYTFDIDMYVNAVEERFENNVPNFCKQINFYTKTKLNGLKVKKMSQGLLPGNKIQYMRVSNIVLTEKELAPMFKIPNYEKYPELLYEANAAIQEKDFSDGIVVGKYKGQDGTEFLLRISKRQLEKHIFLCAGTGGGKSALLFTFLDSLVEDHKQKYGATIIDPNEETLLKFLNHAIAMERRGIKINWDKIHYIDLVDGEYLPFMNLLNIPTAKKDIDVIQSYIMETLQQVYPSGVTPKIDEQLRKIIGTLLLEKQPNSILDGQILLTDRERQLEVQNTLGNGYYEQTYKRMWKDEPSANDIDSTLRRLSLFQSPQMQRLYGIPEFSLPIRKWMDEGHIVLINTKGMSQEKLRLNAGHLISQYVMVAKDRPTAGALPHFLIIDEGKQFQLPILWTNVIPETRKFGLYLVESTQTITALDKRFQNEITENVDTIISGKVGKDGAKIVADLMNGKVKPEKLQALKDRHLFVYTKGANGNATVAEVEVDPPYWYIEDQGRIRPAEYANEEKRKIEENYADKEARAKALELQKRDWKHVSEIDKMLAQRYGGQTDFSVFDASNMDDEVPGTFIDDDGSTSIFDDDDLDFF